MKPKSAGARAAKRAGSGHGFNVRPARDAILTALLVFLSSAACILIIDHYARESQEELVRGDLIRYANAAAGLVDGDAHSQLTSPDQADSPLYKKLIDPLVAMHRRVPEIAYLYSFVVRDGKLHFILDTATQADRLNFDRKMEASGVMEEYESDSPEEDRRETDAVSGGYSYVASRPTQDEYGTFITGLAPIYDSSGKAVGAVGVDLDVSQLYKRLERNRLAMWSGLGAAMLAALTLSSLVWSIRLKALRAERERAGEEAARHEAESEQALLIEALGEVVYHCDLERDVIDYSGRFESLLGLTPSDGNFTRAQWLSLLHADDRARVEAVFEKARASREIFAAEYRIMRPGGEFIWVSDRGVFTFNADGAAISLEGVILDVTQRRISDERFRVIFEASTEPHMLVDAQGVMDCNQATVTMLGYRDKSEIVRQPLTKFWPEYQPDGRTTLEHARELKEATIAHGVHRRQVLKKSASGELIPVETSSTYVVIGGVRLMLIIWHDLRDIKRAQSELADSESKYRELVEGLDIIIFQCDCEGRLTFLNPVWERVTGLTLGESVGAHFSEFVFPEDLAQVAEAHRRELSGEAEAGELSFRVQRKDGALLNLEGNCHVKHDASDAIIGTTGTLTDMTTRRQVERDLIAARDTAEAANRAKSEFLAVMSHEIRTPLNGVLGFSNLLMHTRLDGTQQEYLRTIAGCGDALLTIIDDILDFSRMESGRFELEARAFDLRECVEEVLDMHAARAFTKKLELVSTFEANVPSTVVGDSGRLRQILSNLVGNAVKFTERGEVVVSCHLAWIDRDKVSVEFGVSDTGIGIRREQMEHLFEPFVQADSSMSRRFGGAGLGLAICRRLVHAMNGAISVSSEAGVGTKFTFRVRLDRATVAPMKWTRSFEGRSVLVAASNEGLRASLVHLLEDFGMAAAGCRSAEELRASADEGRLFDLILLDSMFAGAEEVAATLGGDRNVPVILLVPLGVPAPELPPSVSNEWRRLAKPVHAAALRDALESVFYASEISEADAAVNAAVERVVTLDPSSTRILVVEDNLVNQKLIKRMLASLGFEAELADGGEACLEACRREAFNLILMDIQMPGMDGFEATRQLRESGSDTWIVALTAHVMNEDRERCRAAGMNDFLAKPIRIDALKAVLERFAAFKS